MGFWQKVSGIFGVGASHETPAPTPERAFVSQFVELAQAHPLVERVEALAESGLPVRLWLRGGGEQTVFLINTFVEARDDAPDEKSRRLHKLLACVGEVSERPGWEDAAPNLVPLLRVATFGAGVEMAGPLVSAPFAPFLRVFLGRDSETSTSIVSREALGEWQQSEGAALTCACENLSRHVAAGLDAEPYDTSAPYPIWHVTRDDSYEASRLALPGYLASFRGKVQGTPIAIVPHRNLLLIAGDGDDRAIARLAQTAEAEFLASPRSVSSALYTLATDDTVVPLQLPREHALHGVVARGHQLLRASCYAEQKAQLDARFEKDGTDVFVATCQLMEDRSTKALVSFAAVSPSVRSLIPLADRVCFVPLDGEGSPFLVDWDVAMTRASACFEASTEYDPPRVRTLGWPDAAALAELRRRAE